MKTRVLSAFAAVLFVACGGANISSPDSSQKAQTGMRASIKQDASSYQNVVEALYIAYFGRPADPGGLANFESALQAANAPVDVNDLASAYAENPTIQHLVDSFGESNESQTLYGSGTTVAFVTAIFENVIGRTPQSSGLNFWVNAIDSSTLSRGDAALSIMAGALGNGTTQGKLDAQLIANRLDVASSFTTQVAATSAPYQGTAAAASARALLSTVNGTTATAAFQSSVTMSVATLADFVTPTSSGGITLVAGNPNGAVGFSDGATSTASFGSFTVLSVNPSGGLLVGDCMNSLVRKVSPAGVVTTIAGVAGKAGDNDGPVASATFICPMGTAVDAAGNIYVAEGESDRIRKIDPSGNVTTFVKGLGRPRGMVFDSAGNLYVADTGYGVVRKVTPNGSVSVLASGFVAPQAIAIDAGGTLYLADMYAIFKITQSGQVGAFAGSKATGYADGQGTSAIFNFPDGIALDNAGKVYVVDSMNSLIRMITPGGLVSTLAGTRGATATNFGALPGSLYSPYSVAVDSTGALYVSAGATIVKITEASK